MGNLQSILGDCQIGYFPAYLKQFVSSSTGDGDEAYVFYGDNFSSLFGKTDDRSNENDIYYSGPSQRHVRANLPSRTEKEQAVDKQKERKTLADIVDLCLDGIDSPEVRNRNTLEGSHIPGGQTYTPPHRNEVMHLKTETWDEAAQRVNENGTLRIDPITKSSPHLSTKQGLPNSKNISEPSSENNTDRMHRETNIQYSDNNYSGQDQEVKFAHGDSDAKTNTPGDLNIEQAQYRNESENEYCDSETDEESTDKAIQVVSPISPRSLQKEKGWDVRSSMVSLAECRDVESELLKSFTVVVHPSEDPDTPLDQWFLLEADWFREWSAFLRGAPRPGRICNAKLLNLSSGNEPWPCLLPGKHYIGLDRRTWALLYDIYGADVEIVRMSFNIYS